jgi:aminoglycoside phosphotransferase (APT) family kinase protein
MSAEAIAPPPGLPSTERLADVVRRGLNLPAATPVSMREVGELSNINYVYAVDLPARSLYLKVVPELPKRLPIKLPRERVFSEAEGLRRFREYAGADVLIPEVLFVDGEEMALAMSDVGEGRRILFNVLATRFELLAEQAASLGHALGAVHGGTRGQGTPRPPQEEFIIRKVVFDGLLAPGARLAFPEHWDAVQSEMRAHHECLIHADLWSKNLLVAGGAPIAVVDFEGILFGDPAFDLGTLTAVALLPALENFELLPDALAFVERLLQAWGERCGDAEWPAAVAPRTFRATATFLAARGFGPFAYEMSETARQRVRTLARSLAGDPPADFAAFRERVQAVPAVG